MSKITKYFLLFLTCVFVSGCASDGWYAQQAREKFIRLSVNERDSSRKECQNLNLSCRNAPEPTPQELERLKNKDSWKYKIRSWYYGIWE